MNVQDNTVTSWRRGYTAPVADDMAECGGPASERIWAARHGELTIEERREVVDHVALCPQCAESWRLAGELGVDAPVADVLHGEQRVAQVLPFRRRGWAAGVRWVAAAAALVLAVGYSYQSWREGPGAHVRGEDGAALSSLIEEGQPLPRGAFELRWSAVEGATYTVEVTDEELDLIDRAEGLLEPRYQVAAPRLVDLEAGAKVFWQVEARRADGRAELSETFLVQVQ